MNPAPAAAFVWNILPAGNFLMTSACWQFPDD